MTKPKTQKIVVDEIGPVHAFEFDLPPDGGVVRLRGRNGSGKSSIISGVSQLLGSPSRAISVNDDAKGSGSISLGTAVLRVSTSKSTARGTLEFQGIDDKLSISDLVNPRFLDPEAADNQRMKTLVALSGRKASADDFLCLCDNEQAVFDALGVELSDEPLTLAPRVKAAFERQARGFEADARKMAARAEAGKQTVADLDLSLETDEQALAEAFAVARSNVAKMEQHNADAARQAKAVETAQRELDQLAAETDDPDALRVQETELRKAAEAHRATIQPLKDRIAQLEAEIGQIEIEVRDQLRAVDDLVSRKVQAERAKFRRSQVAAAATESVPALYTPAELDAAHGAVLAAQAAMEQGAVVRRAKLTLDAAEHDTELAAQAAKNADDLRRRAAGVDDVLSGMMPVGCPLQYRRGRLVLPTDRDDHELFAELSHGERWRVAFQIVKPMLPAGRSILPLPQEAWESQDPTNQRLIHAEALANGITIVTGEADDCELTAEVFDAMKAGASNFVPPEH